MDVLIRYGFSIEEIKNMMDSNEEIGNISDNDIYSLIDLLGSVGCLSNNIKNIFITNPFCISKNLNDIEKLIKKFKELELDNINLLLDINPYILNISYETINKKYLELKKEGFSKEKITEYFFYESIELI